jgi:membrane-associated phospholipid phosphatase
MATLARHSVFGTPSAETRQHRISGRLVAIAVLGTIFALTFVNAIAAKRAPFDLWLLHHIQSIELHGFEPVLDAIEQLTGSEGAIAMWLLAIAFFFVRRSWGAVVAIFVLPIGGVINETIGKLFVARERPHDESLIRTSSNWVERSFPSGHVMGAVLLYGLLFAIARKIENRALRFGIQISSVTILIAASFQRLWDGAHWPSDVIGAYSLGGLILIALVEIYSRVDRATAGMPLFGSRPTPHNWSQPHAHALTSLVTFEGQHVVKQYAPGFVPTALYWLAFQAPFPYIRNKAAMRAAMHRRNLAAMLSEYWHDTPAIARIESISTINGHPAIVSERVNGATPTDHIAAKRTLTALKRRFEEAGFPTWQIDPVQPRAIDNLLQTADGKYHVVDLESGLVAPFASRAYWKRAIKRGFVPFFDDVYYDVTRAYVARESLRMRAVLGNSWYDRLLRTLSDAERETMAWHRSEPRLWNRLFSAVLSGFGVRTWRSKAKARSTQAREKAMNWMENSVTIWERDGRIDAEEASRIRAHMADPAFQEMVPYLGAQMLVSVPLRFPIGSIVRAAMVAGAWISAAIRFATRRISREQWRRARTIHSPIVFLASALPGFGAVAYLAAKPVRQDRLLLRALTDAVLMKTPRNLYANSWLRRIVARPVSTPNAPVVDWDAFWDRLDLPALGEIQSPASAMTAPERAPSMPTQIAA